VPAGLCVNLVRRAKELHFEFFDCASGCLDQALSAIELGEKVLGGG
jgi:hypothetical protein